MKKSVPDLMPTQCALCGTAGNATQLYPANLPAASFTPAVFSARRPPDRLHFRMVRCRRCGLVRSDPAADPHTLQDLYARSTLTYHGEVDDLRQTYGRYLRRALRYVPQRGSLLEVGCGNGFFLEEALAQGFHRVRGVEPSAAAAGAAAAEIRSAIVVGPFRPGLFAAATLDVVTLFQTLDHLADPAGVLSECRRLLKPGGVLLCLQHDVRAWSAVLLGERSPIIDVEHTYLYSPLTLQRLCRQTGYRVVEVGPAWNRYRLSYLLHLLPLPAALKQVVSQATQRLGLDALAFTLPLGNFYLIARKPHLEIPHDQRGGVR